MTMTGEPEAIVRALFLTPEGRRDPYPHYHRLREVAPVHRSSTLGAWVLSRYDDCGAVLRDPGEHSMGPGDTWLRRLVAHAFNRRTVEDLRPAIERTVHALLDPLAAQGGGNVLEAVGFPLPIGVIAELLGVPEADRPRFRTLVRDVTAVLETVPTPTQLAGADAAHAEMRGYFSRLIAEKRRRPGSDLLSVLVDAKDDDRLTDDELAGLATLLFGAGFETTTNLIGNGLLGLLRHPDQLALLRTEPSLCTNLFDELLRYDGTAQLATRFTPAPIDVAGVTIPAGEFIMPMLGAGNHDPARFREPGRLDVRRTGVEPLSFGGGVHYFVGAALARTEIEVLFRALLARFATIELVGDPPRFRDRLTLRGLEALHVALRPASRIGRAVASPPPPAVTPSPPVRDIDRRLLELDLGPQLRADGADVGWRNALRARSEHAGSGVPRRAPDLRGH